MKSIKKYNFSKVYDLQNSSRSAFYKKILFPKATKDTWSSTDTTLPEETSKQDFDTCIALRTALIKDRKIYVQSGAGIVADSNPNNEYNETVNKAKALIKALE